MNDIDPNEWLLGGSVPSAKFKNVGDFVMGFIHRLPEMQQQRDFETNQPKTWDDGRPRMQMKVVLMTEQQDPDDPDDDGQRAIYIKGQMQAAVGDAVRKAGASGLQVGGKLMVRYTGDGQATQRGKNPPKQYAAKYRVPEPPAVPVDPEPGQPATDEVPF